MTDPTQAATAAWYVVKNDTRSPSPTADPTPYIQAIVRAVLAAKDAEIAGLRKLLLVAVCPMAAQGCDGMGYPAGDPHGQCWQEQCQFCDERNAAISALAGEGEK